MIWFGLNRKLNSLCMIATDWEYFREKIFKGRNEVSEFIVKI